MVVAELTEEVLFKKSSQELTALLYQSCIDNLESAILEINDGRYLEANPLLQSCNDILYRLGAGINYDAGIIADQLEAIYNYLAERLIEANLKKDVSIVKECLKLIKIVAEGWEDAMKRGLTTSLPAQSTRKHTAAYDQDYMYKENNLDHKE